MTPAGPAAPARDVSKRQLARRAALTGLLIRHTVNVLVAVVALLDPASAAQPLGRWLLGAVGAWSVYRLATRSPRQLSNAVDYLLVVAVCLAVPTLVDDPEFFSYNTAPQAIAGTAVVGFSVALPARATLPMVLGLAGAYAVGSAGVVGWHTVDDITAMYYFGLQWGTAAVIRLMILEVATAVDRVRTERQTAELSQQVTEAVRVYEREQLALLHDTAASTLLMVGQGATVPADRLAAQARRDLDLLDDGPWAAPPPRMDVVAALREAAVHLQTPVRFRGRTEVWLDGEKAKAAAAAAREAMNNTDRHARATRLVVAVGADGVTLEDDGTGFDPQGPRHGHGIADSIVARMRRAGGDAEITSAAGTGTTVRLIWRTRPSEVRPKPPADPDRLIERTRLRYGVALTLYALANMGTSVPYTVAHSPHIAVEVVLYGIASVSALVALSGIVRRRWSPAWPAAAALMVVTVVQPMLLPAGELGGQAHWAQNATGWCLLPLVLALPTSAGTGMLVLYWVVGAAVQLIRDPGSEMLVNIGLGTASILAVQLFALVFNGLMRDAAVDAHAETEAHQRLQRRERVAQALQAEYQRRYAKLVDNVVPLLQELRDGDEVDEDLQRRARAESRRLRALFDQATTFDNPLMQQIRPLIDAAESRAVDVVVDVAGALPQLSARAVDDLVAPLARVLGVGMTSTRLVVSATDDEVNVSVVCRGIAPGALDLMKWDVGQDVDVIESDDSVWVLIRHRLPKELREHAAAQG